MDKENQASQNGAPPEADSVDRVDKESQRQEIERAVHDFQRGVDRERSFRFLFDTFYEPTRHFLAWRVSSNEDR